MAWKLSRFHTGDWVEVRSKEEILATLDERGCVDHLPFMPEMLQFCGQRFRINAVAHKTCDTARQTWKGRRLQTAVHLSSVRCDGSAHDGCQAECNLFWKDEWLKPTEGKTTNLVKPTVNLPHISRRCSEGHLLAKTRVNSSTREAEPRYFCQATQMYDATQPLAWWDIRQYIFDVTTGNHSLGRVLRVVWLAALRSLLPRVPFAYRFYKAFVDWMHWWLTGRPSPSLAGQIPAGMPTPYGRLDLKLGEYVQIKSQAEIEQTIGINGKNRGLSFDAEEMAPYCGRVYKVRKFVTKIIDEPSGKMLHMKLPCVMLEGVVCNAEYASCRLNCPRAIPCYWRELWLRRIEQLPEVNYGNLKGGKP